MKTHLEWCNIRHDCMYFPVDCPSLLTAIFSKAAVRFIIRARHCVEYRIIEQYCKFERVVCRLLYIRNIVAAIGSTSRKPVAKRRDCGREELCEWLSFLQ